MKIVLKKHFIQILSLSITLFLVLIISLVPVDYITTAPGYNNEVESFITIENPYPSEGSFHTTSVIVLRRTTSLQYLIGSNEKNVDIRVQPEFYDDIDLGNLRVMGYLSKDDSLARSLVVGFTRSNQDINFTTQTMVYLTYNYLDENTLELGDVVLSVNGNTDIFAAVQEVECEDTATFEIERDGEIISYDLTKHTLQSGSCLFGIQIRTFTNIVDSSIEYTLQDNYTMGSSGGLMQTLYIINQLTPNDLTGGLKIAGTGTIDVDGNVGSIGGVRQKIITSALNGMDVFFVPYLSDSEYDNYIVAQATLDTLDTDMVLVPVQTIDDALAYLEGRFGGAFDE